jgi:KDO2-lipid IV(A) lauroyltransferase
MYYVIGYRKKVVFENLKNSFPEKSDSEQKQIAKKFYSHLTDIFLESLKGITYHINRLLKRYQAVNAEEIDIFYERMQNTITVGGHFGNWEWGNQTIDYLFKAKPIALYKPLSNRYIEEFMRKKRARSGTVLIPVKFTKRAFEYPAGKPITVVMIADQSPPKSSLAYWVNFMNQDTACLIGIERYAKMYNFPVIFYNVNKIKRGYYTISIEIITTEPLKTKTGEITEKFMKLLENCILQNPEYYLWSHRRWKLKKTN